MKMFNNLFGSDASHVDETRDRNRRSILESFSTFSSPRMTPKRNSLDSLSSFYRPKVQEGYISFFKKTFILYHTWQIMFLTVQEANEMLWNHSTDSTSQRERKIFWTPSHHFTNLDTVISVMLQQFFQVKFHSLSQWSMGSTSDKQRAFLLFLTF